MSGKNIDNIDILNMGRGMEIPEQKRCANTGLRAGFDFILLFAILERQAGEHKLRASLQIHRRQSKETQGRNQ